jgi:formylglycine-generating enzyme required for sulfatase activity
VTRRGWHAIRFPVLIGLGAAGLIVASAATLRAPGPPESIIEPQTGMVLVAIEPGTFDMGSRPDELGRGDDEVPRRVTLTKRIFMGRFEVTQAEWAIVMRHDPSHFAGCSRCPVENVDFYEVDEFISNLNAQSTFMRYRLPTEAEWEYACRAGQTTPFSTGIQLSGADANVDARFPYGDGPAGQSYNRTLPVGRFAPNAWGLFDMHGNVWEWTNDWYGPYDPFSLNDPIGAPPGGRRVIRGGSWHFDVNSARCALRYTHAPQDKGYSLGFRIVAEPAHGRTRRPDDYRNR